MQAVLLAGGKGRRLLPLTATRPKPMVPLLNTPLIEYCMNVLLSINVTEVIVLVDYLSHHITNYLGDTYRGMKITYIDKNEPYGTAGAVKRAIPYIDDTFVVFSGDVLTNVNLGELVKVHNKLNSDATIALSHVKDPTQYGIAVIDDKNVITRFLEKPKPEDVFSNLVNAGIYVFNPDLFKLVPENTNFDFSKNLFPLMLERDMKIYGYPFKEYWNDIGRPSSYLVATEDALCGSFKTGKTTYTIKDKYESLLFTGKQCIIHGSVKIRGFCIAGDNVQIGKNVEIWKSVFWSNTKVGKNVKVAECVTGENVVIEPNVELNVGSVIGDNCIIGSDCKIGQNVKIWAGSRIGHGTVMISD